MKRFLRRLWPLGVVVVVVGLEAKASLLGALSGFPLVFAEVVLLGSSLLS